MSIGKVTMNLGIDMLLQDSSLRRQLDGRRVALLGNPASVTHECRHTLEALAPLVRLTAAFGPQHGMLGDKQDNMIESSDYVDPRYGIPVFSLYGEVRRPTDAMMETFDTLLVDLQDIGTRIYTFITTLAYMLDACAAHGKSVWVLDRPNPIGRLIEGTILEPGWESFVGVGPLIMRHGLTPGEIARWYVDLAKLDVDLRVVAMTGYDPDSPPGYGWPVFELSWVNPSPNASSLNMARCFPGTVLIEGTTLSEGRGTTTALEVVGAPDIDFEAILRRMRELAPKWLAGCVIRPCHFEPTFHKHTGKLCSGIQIHTDNWLYRHWEFKPYRIIALLLKAVRMEHPDYPIWREFAYEYETERLAIDLLTGGTFLRDWVDDPAAGVADLDARLVRDEHAWAEIRAPYLLYPVRS
jgi:uncharacterized protein YbbC (DUF1343 family)